MKKSKLIVRAATAADYPAIAALLDMTFTPIPTDQRLKLWAWRYDDNPAKIEHIPPFLVAEQDDAIVGVHGLTPLRVKVDDRIFYSGCSCDLAVDPAARSGGMKLKLRALHKDVTELPLSTSANEPANRITLSLGGKELTPMRRKLIKPVKYSGLIRKKIAARAGTLAGAVAGVLIGKPLDWTLGSSSKTRDADEGVTIATVSEFDGRFDALWQTVSAAYPILVVRDSAYLNWRYGRYPFSGIECFSAEKNGDVAGFAAIHHSVDDDGLPFTAVLELFARPDDRPVFESLLREIIRRSAAAGADTIMAKTNDTDLFLRFEAHGFRTRAMAFSPFTYKNNTDLPEALFDSSGNWYTSLGDGDACYFFD